MKKGNFEDFRLKVGLWFQWLNLLTCHIILDSFFAYYYTRNRPLLL